MLEGTGPGGGGGGGTWGVSDLGFPEGTDMSVFLENTNFTGS